MIEIAEALRLMVDSVTPLPAERVSLEQALGRVLREPATATIDLPPFRQSAMDGYAIRTADTRAASEDAPVSLEVIGEVAAGVHGENYPLGPGQCCRIFTGGRVPDDADAVLPQEIVTRRDGMAVIKEPSPPGRNVRGLGEELARGSLLMEPGGRLTPAMIGALGAAGVARVAVGARPRVRVLITGNEITEPGEPSRKAGSTTPTGRPCVPICVNGIVRISPSSACRTIEIRWNAPCARLWRMPMLSSPPVVCRWATTIWWSPRRAC